MYRLFLKYKDREFIYIIPLVMWAIALKMQHFFRRLLGQGFPQSADSKWYLDYAYSLMENFKIGAHADDILYFGYNILLTLLLALFKDPIAVICIQAVTAGLSVILVYKIARMLFNRLTAIIASYFYLDLWEITIWSMYILSDSFFISLLLLCVYFLLMAFESDKRIYKVLFVLSSLYMLVFRPTGVVALALILVYILLRLNREIIMIAVKKYRLAIGGLLTAVITACVYLYLSHKLDPLIASIQLNLKMVLYNIYAKGWIYDNPTKFDYAYRPDYTINIGSSLILNFFIHNWDHLLILYGKRTIAYLGWWVWNTDLTSVSGVRAFVRHILPAVLFIIGTIAAVRNGLFRKASILWLVILAIFAFCILIFIDGMYRYKAPSLPFIAIVAAYGVDRIVHGIINLTKKNAGMLLLLWKKKRN